MKNKRNILCGAFAVLALSLAGGSLAFTANAEETAAKTLADISIGMVKGASMRIGSAEEGNTEESTGLRFTMQVSKADYEALDKTQYESIEWGMLIAPVENVKAAEFNAENLFGANAKYVFNEENAAAGKYAAINVTETALTPASETNLKIDNADNYYVFSGYMHTIKAGNLTRGFVGRGYVKYTMKGEEPPQYKFAEYFGGDVENNTRSAYYVAAKYVADAAVTDTNAKNYVRTNYLENAVALKTASVNITANDYLEDITVGTYKTEVSETNTVTAKIGERYDLTAAGNAKENYVLRTDLSTTAEPVYRGQQLSIKRYYEANDYIPFSNTEGAVSVATAEDGEEVAGAYKYSAGGAGLKFADYSNKKTDKILRDMAVAEDSKVATSNYVTMKMRWTGGDFNYVSKLGDYGTKDGVTYEGTESWCVSMTWFSGSGRSEMPVRFYTESGRRVFSIAANTWYQVSFPIITNYHDSARFGEAYLETTQNETVYFKNVRIVNEVVDPLEKEAYSQFSLTVNGTTTITTDETEGEFAGSKKVEFKKSGWSDGIVFGHSDMISGKTAINNDFVADGARYISLNVRFAGATGSLYCWDNLGKNSRIENTVKLGEELPSYSYTFTTGTGKWGDYGVYNLGSGKTIEVLRFYDQEGNKVTTLEKDTWYTMILTLMTDATSWWGNMKILPKPEDGASDSAVMYYNSVKYSWANPKA